MGYVRTCHFHFLADLNDHARRHYHHKMRTRICPIRMNEYALICHIFWIQKSMDSPLCLEHGGYGHKPWD